MLAGATDHDYPIIRIADQAVGRDTSFATLGALPVRSELFPLAREVLVQHRQGDVSHQWWKNPALRSVGDRVPVNATLGEDAGSKERLHQSQDALIPNSTPHPI